MERNSDVGCIDKHCISAEGPRGHFDMEALLDLLQNTTCGHSDKFDKERAKGGQLSSGEERITTSSDPPSTMIEIYTVPWHICTDNKYTKRIYQLYPKNYEAVYLCFQIVKLQAKLFFGKFRENSIVLTLDSIRFEEDKMKFKCILF